MIRNKGVSLTEYGIIVGVVAILAVPALSMLGQELSKSISSIVPTGPKAPISVAMIPTNTSAINMQVLTASPTTPSLPGMPTVPPILSTSELTKAVQTAGVNGTTSMLADSLISIANQQKSDGTIDESTYNAIIALANQGHSLAQIESSLETAIKAAGNGGGTGFDNASANLNGKSYSAASLTSMLDSASPDVKAFLDLESKALDSSTLNDPALKSILSTLSNNILILAEASAQIASYRSADGSGINSYDTFMEQIPNGITSYANETTVNANNICSTQSNTAACTQ